MQRPVLDVFALVVFDLAGTTIEDAGQVPAAFTEVLGSHGIEITADQLEKEPHDRLIGSVAELPGLLQVHAGSL